MFKSPSLALLILLVGTSSTADGNSLRSCTRVQTPGTLLQGKALLGRCIEVSGWWASGAYAVPGSTGETRVYRPFSFRREQSDGLGTPSWSVVDTIIVDVGSGYSPRDIAQLEKFAAEEPLFVAPSLVRGLIHEPTLDTKLAEIALNSCWELSGGYPFFDPITEVILVANPVPSR